MNLWKAFGDWIEGLLAPLFEGIPYGAHWVRNCAERWYEGETIAGFHTTFKLSAILNRENYADWKRSGMYDERSIDRLMTALGEAFVNWMKEHGHQFVLTSQNGQGTILRVTEQGLKEEVNDVMICMGFRDTNFVYGGCRVQVTGIEVGLRDSDSEMVERNYNMIAEPIRKQLEAEARRRQLVEILIVDFMRMKIAMLAEWKTLVAQSFVQEYATNVASIRTRPVNDTTVQIEWHFRGQKLEGWRIRGFRKEGCFANGYEEESQGQLVIDRRGSGTHLEHLGGGSYFYTLFFRSPDGRESDFLRFSLNLPGRIDVEPTIKKLTALIERIEAGRKGDTGERRRSMVEAAIAKLGTKREAREAMEKSKEEHIAEIRSRNLQPDQERVLIEEISGDFERIWEELAFRLDDD